MPEIDDLYQEPATAGPDREAASEGVRKSAVALILFVAATLAVVSPLHLTGVIGGGSEPFNPSDAGIAEAVICVVLAAAAVAAFRNPGGARRVAVGAVIFAIIGFLVGLSITVRGGDAFDVTYHSVLLPVLVVTLVLLLRPRGGAGRIGR